jgi:hypothetical protein
MADTVVEAAKAPNVIGGPCRGQYLVSRNELGDHAGLTKLVVVLNIQTIHIICNRFRRSLRGVPTNRLREGPASPPNQRARLAVGFDEHTRTNSPASSRRG